jgi:asparagine synthase (glutamine-hydrolysing)
MCGIWAYIGHEKVSQEALTAFQLLKARGPDATSTWIHNGILLGFHRLAINDLSHDGDQPMTISDEVALVCNGEIYNHLDLRKQYTLFTRSQSDCEVILRLYQKLRSLNVSTEETVLMSELCHALDGEYAFVIVDTIRNRLYAARDEFGVRPLFVGRGSNNEVYFSSEYKGLHGLVKVSAQFKPGHFMVIDISTRDVLHYEKYLSLPSPVAEINLETALVGINQRLRKAVEKRVTVSDRKVCALLSGGLDSSLVAAIAAKCCREKCGYQLETFSIGIPGSTDLKYAQKVADFIGSKHTTIELTEKEFLDAIPETVRVTETYDTTSIRASVGNRLVAKYIRDNTENKVVLNGDYSDEVCGGYLYMRNIHDNTVFDLECRRLVEDIYYFDSLRSDRCISGNGLEPRTPFSDYDFVEYYLSLPAGLRRSDIRQEKYLLREAFHQDNLLPDEVLWRPKEAFSDGVSHSERSWHVIIQEHVGSLVTEAQFAERYHRFPYLTPELKETFWYRCLFEEYYQGSSHLIPYYWLPRYCGDISDPSAREIKELYKTE